MHEGWVEVEPGVRLFYRFVGEGVETIVVLHGGPGFSMEYLADDLAPLAERYRLLFYDQRGSGRSSLVAGAPALDAERFVDDLESLRQHFGLRQLNLLGHSWGAAIAAMYAIRYPHHVGRLIIVGGVPLSRAELDRTFQRIAANRPMDESHRLQRAREVWHADPENAAACRAYYDIWYLPFFGDPTAMGRSKGDFCAGPPASLRNKVDNVDRYTMPSLGEYDWRIDLETVTAQALVLHGTEDVMSIESARQWTHALANSQMMLLDGVGHFPYLEAPQQFFAAVEAFMQSSHRQTPPSDVSAS